MTSHSINSVAVHAGNQIQAAIHTLADHSHAIPGREVAGEAVAVGIDPDPVDPAVGSPTGNRTKSVGHQGADHTEAGLDPGEVGHTLLLRTGLSVQLEVHFDVRSLAHPWCRRRNQWHQASVWHTT